MLKIKHIVLFLLLPIGAFSQNLSISQGIINQKNYYEEVDFELQNDKIIIPIQINGKAYKFLLDTGAPNLLSKRVFDELNIQKTQKISVSDANNNIDTLQMAQLESIKIGNLDFINNVALVSDLDSHFILKCFKLDGFIGSNFFKKSILKISMKDKKITITDDIKKLGLKSKPIALKLVGEQNAPYIKINFNDNKKRTEEVLVDTGMDGFYEVSNRAYALFSESNVFEELSRSSGTGTIGLFGSAPMKEQVLLKSNGLQINNTTFRNLITTTTDDNNSRIGLDLAHHGDIIIDFINKKFYLEAEKEVLFTKKAPVYSPTIVDNKLVIGFVWDQTYQDKLKYGDEIIRIKDHKLNEMDFCDILTLRNTMKEEESYEMEVRSKDDKITLIKIELK